MTYIAICAQQLTKKYADRTVVDRFDLTVLPGIDDAARRSGRSARQPMLTHADDGMSVDPSARC